MSNIITLTFNPFEENTYIIYDDNKECVIIDPGCYEAHERAFLRNEIEKLNLKPVRLLNTHCHLDHVFGNAFVAKEYDLQLEIHQGEIPVLDAFLPTCQKYGISNVEASPNPGRFIEEGEIIKFGNTELQVLLTPGHSPASICFYDKNSHFIIAGDVLFREGIGRTDLPGGDYNTLINSIKTELYPLPNQTTVYPGHGPRTKIGFEKINNPFVNASI